MLTFISRLSQICRSRLLKSVALDRAYRLATQTAGPLRGWSARLSPQSDGRVTLVARFSTSCGGWMTVTIAGLARVPAAPGRTRLTPGSGETTIRYALQRVLAHEEALEAGRFLTTGLDTTAIELVRCAAEAA
jgi:hypothetical protein